VETDIIGGIRQMDHEDLLDLIHHKSTPTSAAALLRRMHMVIR
jgi:hypothetical protein